MTTLDPRPGVYQLNPFLMNLLSRSETPGQPDHYCFCFRKQWCLPTYLGKYQATAWLLKHCNLRCNSQALETQVDTRSAPASAHRLRIEMISLQFGRMLPDCSMFARCIVRPLAPRRCMPLPRYSRAHPKSTFSSSAPKKRAYQTTPEPDATPISAMTVRRQLSELQSEEQRRVLDTVSDIRKCGLDTVLSLPQIVVCGDQSSGKSSVLEALTEIPFPRADNVCTRFATEICLRRDAVSSLTIKVIPDSSRIADEQDTIKAYSETITDFDGLPTVIDNAKRIMGIGEHGSAFARDILSIQIAGPDRPHLSLVDIPGLIHSSTKGVSENDVTVVGKITSHYIEQPRTICLAVISATNDAANQSILEQVRKVDPQGEVGPTVHIHRRT